MAQGGSLFRGKPSIEKLIRYLERHQFMCEHQENRSDEALFLHNHVELLKKVTKWAG